MRSVYFGPSERHAVASVASALGSDWQVTRSAPWVLACTRLPLTESPPSDGRTRWVNHVPGSVCLVSKAQLGETLERAGQWAGRYADDFGFVAQTFRLPARREEFLAAYAAAPDALWILKPIAGARGEGISMLQSLDDLPDSGYVVQRYIDRPDLYDGRKYVLRRYVLIRSVEPLVVYLFDDGFTKPASAPYTTDPKQLSNRFVHLTNPDVNRLNTEIAEPVPCIVADEYRAWLERRGADPAALDDRIRDAICRAVLAARPRLLAAAADCLASDQHYELLGLDILVDRDLRPWVCECNMSPSLKVESGTDDASRKEADLKTRLVRDLITAIGVRTPDSTTTFAARCGGFHRIFPHPNTRHLSALLGVPGPADQALHESVHGEPFIPPPLRAADIRSELGDDGAVIETDAGSVHLNATATWVLLGVQDGEPPDAMARELAQHFDLTPEDASSAISDCLVDLWNVGALQLA